MPFLPANCIITPEDEQEILLYKEAGLNVREIIRAMKLKQNVKHGGLSFLDKDIHNLFIKTFVTIMKKPSKTIITDQDPWMSQTISIEMPTTKHSFCIWHITSKFSCWFLALLRTEYQSWCGDFYTLYRMTSAEEFEHNWPILVAKYNLQNNNHVQGLYEIRMSWAPCYLRNYFFGGMTSTSRSESINAFIKRFVSSRTSLKDFVRQVDLAIEEIENSEAHNKMLSKLRHPSLKTKSPLEEQAFEVLTPFAFKKFQEEFERASRYLVVHIDGDEFIIRYFDGDNKNHKVFWDGNIIMCSCKNFEFWGILCRHIFRVLLHKDCFKIPPIYFPLRWCSDNLQRSAKDNEISMDETSINNEDILLDNMPDADNDILCPPKSIPKGRPRKGREKGGKESATKGQNRCSLCKQRGHTRPKCPQKDNIFFMVDDATSTSQKKRRCLPHNAGLNPVFNLKH
ncbi:protein FAR1-related sequence 11 [Tanacetum coccineum]